MAKKDVEEVQDKKQKGVRRLIEAYRVTRQTDKRLDLYCLGSFFGVGIVIGILGGIFLAPISGGILGFGTGLLAALFIFGRRAEAAAYARVEGRPGAAGAALGVLGKQWKVQQVVAVTKSQDIVHRVVGRPGVVLVGEGNTNRVHNLLAAEKRKHARVVGDIPIYDVVVSDDGADDTVTVRKLNKRIRKLPKNITPADITDLTQRLKALDAMRPPTPLPRGPMPTTSRQAKRQMMRGR